MSSIEEPENNKKIKNDFSAVYREKRNVLRLGQNIQNKGVCFYDEIFSAVR